jgi:hypothetical protein
MTATIVGRSRVEDGRMLGEVTYVTVDQELSREDGSAHEAGMRIVGGASPTAGGTELRRSTVLSRRSTIASRAGPE